MTIKLKKPQKNSNGFGAIGLMLVIVIIVVIGLVGWFVYSTNHSTKNDTNNDATHISSAGPNPTSGWQSQCLSGYGLCLKHPSSWTVGLASSSGFTVGSPDSTAFVQVELVGKHNDTPENFYVTSQTYTYFEGTTYKVFGGYTVGENDNSPFYAVVLPGFGNPSPMKIDSVASIITPQTFIYVHVNNGVEASVKLLPQNGVPANATPQESVDWCQDPEFLDTLSLTPVNVM